MNGNEAHSACDIMQKVSHVGPGWSYLSGQIRTPERGQTGDSHARLLFSLFYNEDLAFNFVFFSN